MVATGGDALDPAFTDLLGNPGNALRPPSAWTSLTRFRQIADAPMAAVRGPIVASVEEHAIVGLDGHINVRLYRPTHERGIPVVLFIHGGGFVIGSLETHDAICRLLALRAGVAVLSVGYRLAPETPYPGPLDDCLTALTWLANNAIVLGLDLNRLALCGDSAGGHLAIATAIRIRGRDCRLRHIGLLYPIISPGCDTPSAHLYGSGHLLTRACLIWFWSCYLAAGGGASAELDLLVADLVGLPSISVSTAAFDPLRDEGEAFAAVARGAGVNVTGRRYLGMIHGFVSLPHLTPVALRAIDDLATDLRTAFEPGLR